MTINCKKRRKALLKRMKQNSLCIIEAGGEKIRNNDVSYLFRANSSFFYLTGLKDPNLVLLLYKGKSATNEVLFIKKPNKLDEVWNGKLPSTLQIQKKTKIKHCKYLSDLDETLISLLSKANTIYHSLDEQSVTFNLVKSIIKKLQKKYRAGVTSPSQTFSLDSILSEMRLIKDNYEIKMIRYAANISVKAHIDLMRNCRPGITENDIEVQLRHIFNKNQSLEAYPSIVASGKNACTLHYVRNESILKNGELLLTDAACEFNYYASDITRTIPINGTFTKPQKEIYNIVLKAQLKAIDKCQPGNHLKQIHEEAVKWICKGLIELGLIKSNLPQAIKNGEYKDFYMHNTGHWLGLDVHDPSPYNISGKPVKLKPGMIFTVEPGIYIKPKRSIPKKYHNIGVRIEDDILIKKNGCEILTCDVPKTANDIETIMSKR